MRKAEHVPCEARLFPTQNEDDFHPSRRWCRSGCGNRLIGMPGGLFVRKEIGEQFFCRLFVGVNDLVGVSGAAMVDA